MTIPIENLKRSTFIEQMEWAMSEILHESGWRRAVLINSIYKRRPRIEVTC
jgi:hypothetical protein